ncbi:MAG: MarR family transcriptional regulator [Rhizobacter sp.]|nr:MarR family transcriptional regulator [Rhizobacter sp.]
MNAARVARATGRGAVARAAAESAAPADTRVARKTTRRALDDSALAHLVGYAASRAALELRKVFARHMEPFDLRIAEFTILMLVAANDDVNQKQLGDALDISPPNMAVTLDRMVERGWVERVRSTHDRRAQHVVLTARGRTLAERTRRISATMEEPALAMLSAAERALLIELLRKIGRRVDETG